MKLRWIDKEVVTIPDVGQVRPGIEFAIDDDRAQDLLLRKLAERVQELPSSSTSPPDAKDDRKRVMGMTADDAAVKEH